ncbi:hypothetical protein [Kineosporia sp. NBRC 101677]|uniref:hypothetical protein n=1 Tax=Kineosporia sp. NBRC 101677 TaxID=3032197 RepID=UPI0025562D27|nr:hypothetical protein [Kineosporia sp. NBRC 101677]
MAGRWTGEKLQVFPYGQDERLPALAALVRDGGEVVAHRAGRRAVVRHSGRFTKVLPVGKARGIAETLTQVAQWPGVVVPPVLGCTDQTVTLGALPGATLHEWLKEPRSTAELAQAGARVGLAVRSLHRGSSVGALPHHDLAAELDVTLRWIELAERLTGTELPRPGNPAVAPKVTVGVPLHRDLHDKQIVLPQTSSDVGLLDLDLLAGGEAALDLANLLVHLELRARQGLASAEAVPALSQAVLEAYAPSVETLSRMGTYAQLTRLRLAAVYAFRPADRPEAASLLLSDPLF